MMETYVLVHAEVGQAARVAREAAALDGVLSAEAVTGPYDVIVRAGADDLTGLNQGVIEAIHALKGVTRTLTCPVLDLFAHV